MKVSVGAYDPCKLDIHLLFYVLNEKSSTNSPYNQVDSAEHNRTTRRKKQ